jgi:hypothetical protein
MSRPRYYVLENKIAIPATLQNWSNFFEKDNRRVRFNTIKKYNIDISTVFLGLDMGYPRWSGHTKNYRPVLFETMIFWNGNELNNWYERYSTWDEALAGHRETMRLVIKTLREKDD